MANTVQKFLLNDLDIRGAVVHLDSAWQEVLNRRAYPTDMVELLGQSTVATILMSTHIKFSGKLMLQIQSPSDLKLLVVQNDNHHCFRSLAQYAPYKNTALTQIADGGLIAIIVEYDQGKEPYQGVVGIEHDTLANNLETYFNQSEQLKTVLVLRADENQAAGILLQMMPGSTASDDDWERLRHLVETLNLAEMRTINTQTLVARIFTEDDKTIYSEEGVNFECGCSAERTLSMLASLDEQELQDIVAVGESVTVGCDFCGKQYEHDAATISALLSNKIHPN